MVCRPSQLREHLDGCTCGRCRPPLGAKLCTWSCVKCRFYLDVQAEVDLAAPETIRRTFEVARQDVRKYIMALQSYQEPVLMSECYDNHA